MGRVKEDFLDFIYDSYPELKSLKLELDNEIIDFQKSNYLLPYIAFTNSLDNENRFINVFHSPFSEHYKFIPFYIVLAVFKKEVDKMRGTLQPIENDLIVLNNGQKCTLTKLDLENRKIIFKYSQRTGDMSFDEFLGPFISPYSEKQKQNYELIKKLVEEYQLIHSNTLNKLLETPKFVTSGYDSGVIIFTNKGKFNALFNNIRITGLSINSRIPAVNAVYDRKVNSYRYDRIDLMEEGDKTKSRPFILIASYLDIESIDIFREKFPHLNTIVFDEAEQKLEDIKKILPDIKASLKSKEISTLKDVYTLTADSSLHLSYDFNAWEIENFFSWITTPQDMSLSTYKSHDVRVVSNSIYADLLREFEVLRKNLLRLFKELPYEVVSPIYNSAKEILIRLYSVYEITSLKNSLKELHDEFCEFAEEYLDDTYDRKLIDDFESTIKKALNLEECEKLNMLNSISQEMKLEKFSKIGFIKRNSNIEDSQFFDEWLSNQGLNYEILTFDQNLEKIAHDKYDLLLFFEIRKPFINSIFIHDFAKSHLFLLSDYEYEFYKRGFSRVKNILNRITKSDKRKVLLNISDNDANKLLSNDPLIDKKLESQEKLSTDEDIHENEKEILYNESENKIRELIIEKLKNSNTSQLNSNGHAVPKEELVIFFEDRTIQKASLQKYFYIVNDGDVSELDELKVRAEDLEKGDDVMLFNLDHENLQDLLIEKMNSIDRYRSIYNESEKWRHNIKVLCDQISYKKASNLLSNHIKRHHVTIENWCEGHTLVPNQHKKVIDGINYITKNYGFKGMQYMNNPNEIKNASRKIKGLLLSLPSKLKERSVMKLYDLEEISNSEDDILLDHILNDVEIKTVSKVLRI